MKIRYISESGHTIIEEKFQNFRGISILPGNFAEKIIVTSSDDFSSISVPSNYYSFVENGILYIKQNFPEGLDKGTEIIVNLNRNERYETIFVNRVNNVEIKDIENVEEITFLSLKNASIYHSRFENLEMNGSDWSGIYFDCVTVSNSFIVEGHNLSIKKMKLLNEFSVSTKLGNINLSDICLDNGAHGEFSAGRGNVIVEGNGLLLPFDFLDKNYPGIKGIKKEKGKSFVTVRNSKWFGKTSASISTNLLGSGTESSYIESDKELQAANLPKSLGSSLQDEKKNTPDSNDFGKLMRLFETFRNIDREALFSKLKSCNLEGIDEIGILVRNNKNVFLMKSPPENG